MITVSDYSKSDAAQDTSSSTSQVSASWHAARDDTGDGASNVRSGGDGDRYTYGEYAQAYETGQSHGLFTSSTPSRTK